MTTRAVAEMDDWESTPFSGGYAGLRDLADGEFSGVVQSGAAKLCLLNGTAVGVLAGSIEDFEGASGTAYEAPSPALPLLALMQDRGDEVRAKYYTEETPISDVDRTLSDGGFSGYLELSENVLSGDYYVVYHAGRSMAVAWVGNSKRLLTGDEAFERADGEVGIYEVRQVDIDPVEIPGGSPDGAVGAGPTGGTDLGVAADTSESGGADTDAPADAATDPDRETAAASDRTGTTGPAGGTAGTETADAADTTGGAEPVEQTERTGGTDPEQADPGAPAADTRSERTTGPSAGQTDEGRRTAADSDAGSPAEQSGAGRDTGAGGATPAERLETRSVPSLDPARTSDDSGDDAAAAAAGVGSRSDAADADGRESEDGRASNAASTPETEPAGSASPRDSPGGAATGQDVGAAGESGSAGEGETGPTDERAADPDGAAGRGPPDTAGRVADLEADVADLEAEVGRLESELASVESERDELREERDRLAAEVERLETEIERLRTRQDERAATGGAGGGRRLSPDEALDGTNLFVRYASKGKATLESAHAGDATREAVSENLTLEVHTQFDADEATVDGRPVGEFLRGTLQYRFAHWVVDDLIYEIRETDSVAALRDLYDAIPEVDRVELDGAVSVDPGEDGQHTETESFDVVLRDRMGNPLVVANLNDSREAASEGMMSSLVTASSRVVESTPSLAAAVFVTASYFEPGALETAADATGGSLLSRDKRQSFVKLSRKRGYHLCLAEAREGQFHLAVPEL